MNATKKNATTHRHVYVGLASSDDARAGREWIAGLDPTRYARLVEMFSCQVSNAEFETILDQLGAPRVGIWRDYLYVMQLHARSVNPCPLCPA